MTRDPSSPDPNDIPPRLAGALREVQGPLPDLSGLDRAVLGMAGSRVRRRSTATLVWRVGAALTAAAAVALMAYVAWPQRVAAPGLVALDRSRPVTILEAFRLARLLEIGAGQGVSPTWDVTGDGAVDRRDVDALAAEAVRLGSGSQDDAPGGRASTDEGAEIARGGHA